MVDAFVSYASADAERAQALATALERAGFSVWWDRHLLAGQRFQQEIQDQLAAAAAVVVLWTPTSVRSEWVYSEARRGHQRGALVQVRTREVGIDDLPAPFDALHCPDADDGDALRRAVAALVGAPAKPAQPTVTTRERKVVTVLSAELEPEDDLDPEDLEGLAHDAVERVHAEVARYGGTSAAEPGLTVTATFGAARAREDDPVRAVLTALAVRDAVPGSGFTVRIGVAAGEAVVTGAASVSGSVTADARRLRESAAPGTVRVDAATRTATAAAVEVDDNGVALAARAADTEPPDPAATMVGREDELAQLQRSFLRAARDSSVQLLTVIGEPGLGKSRLVQAFAEWVAARAEPVVWRQGRTPAFGGSTYAALAALVRTHAGIGVDDPEDTVRTRLAEAAAARVEGTDLAGRETWLAERLAPLVGLPGPEATPEELSSAWGAFLAGFALDAPAVLVFEDVHWAEPPLLDFLADFLQQTSGLPLLVLVTARPELLDRVPSWGAGHRNATTLALAPLAGSDLAALLREMSADDPLPDELAVAVLSQSGGNPLYAREFLSLYRSRGGDVDAAALPDSVRAMVAARLDALAGHAKRVLQTAAVIGHTFWSGGVEALWDEPSVEVEPELRDLAGRELVRRSHRSRIAGEAEFAFAHALTADVALASLTRADRARLFRAAAEWHAARLPVPDASEQAGLVAHLYGQAHAAVAAGRPGPEDLAELAELTAGWHAHAARYAQRLDGRAWLRHAQEAVAHTADDHPARAARLLDLGAAQASLAEQTRAARTLQAAVAAAERSGDEAVLGAVLVRLSGVLENLSRSREAEAAIERAVEVLERGEPHATLVDAYLFRSQLQGLMGRTAAARESADRALALAREVDVPTTTLVTALLDLGEQRLWDGDLGGLEDLARGEEAALASGQPRLVVAAHRSLALAASLTRGYPEASRRLELALGVAEETGQRRSAVLVANQLVDSFTSCGRLDEAVRLAERYVAESSEEDNPGHVADLRVAWAWALVNRGELDEAAALLDLALPVMRTAVTTWLAGSLVIDATRVRAQDPAAPNPSADELVELLEGPDLAGTEPEAPERLARLFAGSRTALLERLLEVPPTALPPFEHGHTSARAVLAETGGRAEEALSLHVAAAAGWEQHGDALERLHSLLGAARCALALGRAAGEHLDEVHERATAIGARPLAEAAAALRGA